MTILGSLPILSLFSSQSKPDRIRKSIGPISTVLKRQPFSSTSQRALPKSSSYYQYTDAGASNTNSSSSKGPEVVTENSILSNFPRPNLMPTLHFSLFSGHPSPTEGGENPRSASQCNSCSGPHSTDFCPC